MSDDKPMDVPPPTEETAAAGSPEAAAAPAAEAGEGAAAGSDKMTIHVKTPKEKKTLQTTPKANVKEVSSLKNV